MSASTFKELNYGWSTRPITVYADQRLNNTEISQLNEAINALNSTRFGKFFIYGGTKDQYSILTLPGISGVTKDAFVNNSAELAQTLSTGNGVTRTKFAITINSNYNFTTNTNGYYLKSVLMHELGHAIGLKHSIFSNSFMYKNYNGITSFLNTDIEAIDIYY